MKRNGIFTVMFVCAVLGLHAQDALSIVRSSRDRLKADTIYSESTMVLTRKNGSTSERSIKQFVKEGSEGKRIVIEFLRPVSVEGVRFLTMKTSAGTDNGGIFLPRQRVHKAFREPIFPTMIFHPPAGTPILTPTPFCGKKF